MCITHSKPDATKSLTTRNLHYKPSAEETYSFRVAMAPLWMLSSKVFNTTETKSPHAANSVFWSPEYMACTDV